MPLLLLALACVGPDSGVGVPLGFETADTAVPYRTDTGEGGWVPVDYPAHPSYREHLQPLFDRDCQFCHMDLTTGANGLSLSHDDSYASLVGHAATEAPDLLRVSPGEPDTSYLVMKLEGTASCIPGGDCSQMPMGGARWSDDELDALRAWIADGALFN